MKSEFSFDQFKASGEMFLTALIAELGALGLPVLTLKCDHLCFRVETPEEYQAYKQALMVEATLLTEAPVNGRAISTFKLHRPFEVNDHLVSLVELPAPKLGVQYQTGFEHAEFVINEGFDCFSARFPRLNFSRSGNKNLNPELCLPTKVGQCKFHHLSLERVIEIEMAVITDIIFDLDGTLIKSRENIYEINRLVFSEALGRTVSPEEAKEKFHPEFSKLLDAFGVECPAKRKKAVSAWGQISEKLSYTLFDGVADLLTSLSKGECRLHLWTARDETSAKRILAAHRLETVFTTLSFGTEANSKPHNKSAKFDWQSLVKNSALVLGDSPSDILGSKNIRAVGAAALWDPHSDGNALVSAGAELFFHQVHEFGGWLSEKGVSME